MLKSKVIHEYSIINRLLPCTMHAPNCASSQNGYVNDRQKEHKSATGSHQDRVTFRILGLRTV